MKKHILTLLISIFIIPSIVLAQGTYVPAGNVSGIWTKANSPYRIEGDITIQSGDTLIIEPGVTVEFQEHYKLTINGQIFAVGAENDTILFTVKDHSDFDTDLNDPAGSWNGIEFYDNPNDTSFLIHCRFEYAKDVETATYYEGHGGAVLVAHRMRLVISNCLFYHNYAIRHGGALAGFDCRFTITESSFLNNISNSIGGAVWGQNATIEIFQNKFFYNQASSGSGGAIACFSNSNFVVSDNIIAYNNASAGGGIDATLSIIEINNNFITNNIASSIGGGIIANSSYPNLKNNIICNNDGGGIHLSQSDALIYNNTICNNNLSEGGIYFHISNARVVNTIIYGNTPHEMYLSDALSFPDFYNCLTEKANFEIAGGITFYGAWENIYDGLNPEFNNPTTISGSGYNALEANWSLEETSPCINTGTPNTDLLFLPPEDIYHNNRISNGIIDIGAAEKHIGVIEVPGNITSNQSWFADTVKVTGDVTVDDNVTLTITKGTVVQFQGYYGLNIQGTLRTDGTSSDMILFTCHPDSIESGWKGITFFNDGSMNDNDTSIIQYTKIQYGKKNNGGGMSCSNISRLLITNSWFEKNEAIYGGAIYCSHSKPLIKNNTIIYNTAGKEGGQIGAGGGIYLDNSSTDIIGNNISYNYNRGIGGWGIETSQSGGHLEGNFITNHQGSAIWGRGGTNQQLIFMNNVIVQNGGGIDLSDNPCYLINNTISNNGCDILYIHGELYAFNTILRGGSPTGQIQILGENTRSTFINCNIEGGISSVNNHSVFPPEYENIIDADPAFKRKIVDQGPLETIPEDWQLLPVSPCINKGINEVEIFGLPDHDFMNQSRINDNIVDIGAIENQSGPPEFLSQPVGGVKCSGDSIVLSVELNDTVYYQWKKDGKNITGANSSYLKIDSLATLHEGNYNCQVSNTYGTINSATVLLIVKSPPVILAEPESQWIQKDIQLDLEVNGEGTPPMRFQWYKDGDSIPLADKPLLRLLNTDYNHEGEYQCKISNVCGEKETTPAILSVAPEICMVTVDTATGNNLIIWEKQSSAPIVSYNIYREGVIAGLYDLIGTVPYDDLSIFVDTAANPEVQAYWYKIAAVDTGGYESDLELCAPHKTIHLLVTLNPETGATQLDWDRYIGFEYGTFHILRSTQESGFSIYHSMASSTTTWSDLNPEQAVYYYRVAVEKSGLCSPTGSLKAESGPYSHSMSNMEDNRLQAGEENNSPTLITITDTTIYENQIVGSFIGKLQTDDADTLDVHTYTLVSGTGSDDNMKFTILGDLLLSAQIFDYETKSSYSIRVRSTDNGTGNLHTEQVFHIAVLDAWETGINNAPTGITITSDTIEENHLPGTLVGRFETTDPDVGDVHTYALVQGTGSDDNSSFSIMGNLLIAAQTFDYETKQQYYIRIRSTDNGTGNLYTEMAFTINIIDTDETQVNNTPTDISLDNNLIDENKPVGIFIGRFQTTDPDELDTHIYSLVPGTGSDDNSSFTILGDLLLSAGTFDYELKDTLHIRIRSLDNGESRLYLEKTFIIIVNDLLETGIDDVKEKTMLIYPNPFTNTTNILFPNPESSEYTLIIRNLSGRTVRIIDNITTSQYVLNKEDLVNGYYLIELRGDKVFRGRIIIE